MSLNLEYIHISDSVSDLYAVSESKDLKRNGVKIGTIYCDMKEGEISLFFVGPCGFSVSDLESLIEAMKNRRADMEYGS